MNKFAFLNDVQWHFFHIRPRTPFFVHFWTYGLTHPTVNIYDFDYSVKHIGHFENKVIMDDDTFQKQRKELLKRLKAEPGFLIKVLGDFYKKLEKIEGIWGEINSERKLKNARNEHLILLLQRFFDSMVVFSSYLLFPLYVEEDISTNIHAELKKQFPSDVAERFYAAAVTQKKETLITQELRALLKIALKIKNGQDFKKDLDKHVNSFSWMKNKYYTMEFYDEQFYAQRAKEFAQKDPEKELNEIEKMHKEIVELSLKAERMISDATLIMLMKTTQESVYFRNFRGEKLYHSSYYIKNLLSEIAKRLGIIEKEVVYLTAFEIMDYLKKGNYPNRRIIDERMKRFGFIINVNDDLVITGKELDKAQEYVHLPDISFDTNVMELHGTKACEGKVSGKVCLVRTLNEMQKITKGCILVTHSTTPEYVPFLGKVAAIITEEGGILSHAAIISRELRIPCVIGTKIATKVLNDGNMVEVDAIHGVVRKLK